MDHVLTGCLAPAKLNLFLHVTGRRPNGYHELQTVFQLLDHGDTLDFSVRNDGAICRLTDIEGVPAESDLIVRAARMLQKHTGTTLGADIQINKILPMGGGLGGGSSDAATTLIALNHLWQTGVSRDELMRMSVTLGADVPFFIFGSNAFAEGVGEQLSAVETPKCWYVVIEPGVHAPTANIFSHSELTRDSKVIRIADFSRAQKNFGRNDLQAVAVSLFAPIADALSWLAQHGEARMTGSGACVFAAFDNEEDAQAVVKRASKTGNTQWKVWKARAIERHPLSHLLK